MLSFFSSTKDILGFDDRPIFLRGLPIIGLLINLLYFGHLLQDYLWGAFSVCYLVSIIHTACYWMIYRVTNIHFIKKYPHYKDTKKRLNSTFTVIIPVFVIITFILDRLTKWLFEGGTTVEMPSIIIKTISISIVSLLVFFLYESLSTSHKLKQSLMVNAALEKANINSQLMGLRSQINPHFLFNSLNTLTSLIHKDAERADQFATQLAKVYRYILENRDDALTTLQNELDWLDAYVHLLKERFGNNISIDIDVPINYRQKMVVPLCLQILFENAIKHNIITINHPLIIKVSVSHGMLQVRNNLQEKTNLSSSTRFGLENIKMRYSFFTKQQLHIQKSMDAFVVSLPLLTENTFIDG